MSPKWAENISFVYFLIIYKNPLSDFGVTEYKKNSIQAVTSPLANISIGGYPQTSLSGLLSPVLLYRIIYLMSAGFDVAVSGRWRWPSDLVDYMKGLHPSVKALWHRTCYTWHVYDENPAVWTPRRPCILLRVLMISTRTILIETYPQFRIHMSFVSFDVIGMRFGCRIHALWVRKSLECGIISFTP